MANAPRAGWSRRQPDALDVGEARDALRDAPGLAPIAVRNDQRDRPAVLVFQRAAERPRAFDREEHEHAAPAVLLQV